MNKFFIFRIILTHFQNKKIGRNKTKLIKMIYYSLRKVLFIILVKKINYKHNKKNFVIYI